MNLCVENLSAIRGIEVPSPELLNLPEKVLQFGTGVLLRGLPDDIIDRANRAGRFNGRIVAIKSTAQGSLDAFARQQNLYTICVRGWQQKKKVVCNRINSSISRVLDAGKDWAQVLDLASSSAMQIVISNTTEAGIAAVDDRVTDAPPASFPGKLLSFLHTRYRFFSGAPDSGMTLLPTELIGDNGDTLSQLLVQKARDQELSEDFVYWLQHHNRFCNTLVDRIVPGAYREPDLGYEDELMIMAEPYYLWAIEAGHAALPFLTGDDGVVLAPSIYQYRELKLRLLNATHTFGCALALRFGFNTVKQAMADADFADFTGRLMDEIGSAIANEQLTSCAIAAFAEAVRDRFRNPFLEHAWTNISQQYPHKFHARCVPVIERWYAGQSELPVAMALGTAAFLLTMKQKPEHLLRDQNLWGTDLSSLPGWETGVLALAEKLQQQSVKTILKDLPSRK